MNILESLENLNVSEECFNDIMGIVEEIINEVSVNMWKQAAINSSARRGFEAGKMDSAVDAIIKKKKWSDKDEETVDKSFNANDRMGHAQEVAHLPSSKRSASKVLKTAKKITPSRIKQSMDSFKKWENNERDLSAHRKIVARKNHAENLYPVKKEF